MGKKNQEKLSLDKEVGEEQRTLLWNKETDAQSKVRCSGIHKNGFVEPGRSDEGTQG